MRGILDILIVTWMVLVAMDSYRVAGSGYEGLVPRDLFRCCSDKDPEVGCGLIDTMTVGQDGHQYIFSNGYVIRANFRSNGYPEIYEHSYEKYDKWFPPRVAQSDSETGLLDDEKPMGAHLYDSKINILKDGAFHHFSAPGVRDKDSQEDNSCSHNHPAYCDKASGDFLDMTSSISRGTGDEDEIRAYYLDEGHVYEKLYHGWEEKKGSHRVPMDKLNSISIYYEHNEVYEDEALSYGWYFRTDGFACKYQLERDTQDSLAFRSVGIPLIKCFPANIFLGCPQSFCYRSDVDDILMTSVLNQKALLNASAPATLDTIAVFRGAYYFQTKDARLPIAIPTVDQMSLLHPTESRNIFRNGYIDAAVEVNKGRSQTFTIIFKDSDLMIFGDETGSGLELEMYDVFPRIWDGLLTSDSFGSIDAAFHVTQTSTVYLLMGSRFVSYTYQIKRTSGSAITFHYSNSGSFDEYFPGVPEDVDGALTVGDDIYILKGSYVYKQNFERLQIKETWSQEWIYFDVTTQRGLFDVEHCPRPKEDYDVLKANVRQDPYVNKDKMTGGMMSYKYASFFGIIMIPIALFGMYCMKNGCYTPPERPSQDLQSFTVNTQILPRDPFRNAQFIRIFKPKHWPYLNLRKVNMEPSVYTDATERILRQPIPRSIDDYLIQIIIRIRRLADRIKNWCWIRNSWMTDVLVKDINDCYAALINYPYNLNVDSNQTSEDKISNEEWYSNHLDVMNELKSVLMKRLSDADSLKYKPYRNFEIRTEV